MLLSKCDEIPLTSPPHCAPIRRASQSVRAADPTSTTMPDEELITIADRVAGALWGMLIFDALSMPVHWFYGGNRQIQQTYGSNISKYEKPPHLFPGSIMALSSTGGAGRGTSDGDIIGTVINHGDPPAPVSLCAPNSLCPDLAVAQAKSSTGKEAATTTTARCLLEARRSRVR